jgi:hypothetical protein
MWNIDDVDYTDATKKMIYSGDSVYQYQAFGSTIAIDDDVLMVGAPGDGYNTKTGSVTVFSTSSFKKLDVLYDGETNKAGGAFGSAISLSGKHAVVGAPHLDNDIGAAYYFYSEDKVSWDRHQKIVNPVGQYFDYFGCAVAVYHRYRLLIGSYGSDQVTGRGGAAYSYLWKDGSWTYVATILPPKSQDFLYFGRTIAMSHDYAMIGATGENSGGMYAGAVYIYKQNNGYWEYFQALYGEADSLFGSSISMTSEVVAIGAPGSRHSSDSSTSSVLGRVGIYRLSNSRWSMEEYIGCRACSFGDGFGVGVATIGDAIVIGKRGGAFVHQYNPRESLGSRWSEYDLLDIPDTLDDKAKLGFGVAVGLMDSTALVGSIFETEANDFNHNGVLHIYSAKLMHEEEYNRMNFVARLEASIHNILYVAITSGLFFLAIELTAIVMLRFFEFSNTDPDVALDVVSCGLLKNIRS